MSRRFSEMGRRIKLRRKELDITQEKQEPGKFQPSHTVWLNRNGCINYSFLFLHLPYLPNCRMADYVSPHRFFPPRKTC